MPKGEDINDLWSGQAEALKAWHEKRNNKDIVIKLNTGGGKTLVGLLIAQSIANETNGSTLYLCPTRQLMNQTYELAQKYGFNCAIYLSGRNFDNSFLRGDSNRAFFWQSIGLLGILNPQSFYILPSLTNSPRLGFNNAYLIPADALNLLRSILSPLLVSIQRIRSRRDWVRIIFT